MYEMFPLGSISAQVGMEGVGGLGGIRPSDPLPLQFAVRLRAQKGIPDSWFMDFVSCE